MRTSARNTFPILMTVAAAVAATLPFACTDAYAGVIQQNTSQALVVTETATNGQIQTSATIGEVTDYAGNSNQAAAGASVQNAGAYGVVPANTSLDQVFSSSTAAQAAVSSYLSNYLATIAKSMSGFMKASSGGVAMGFFTFVQNVQIANPAGSPTQSQVFGTLAVYPNGQYEYLGTNVNNSAIYILYAIYQQARNASYLPAGWTLPYAGETQWELLKVSVNGNTLQASPVPINGNIWNIINDNGAYDAPVTMNGQNQVVNYSAGVSNWVNQQIVPMMKQYNASLGVISYGEQVKVARTSSGAPITAISVNSRSLTSGCEGNTLTSAGQYGYLLNYVNSTYTVQPSGEYTPLQLTSTTGLSPTQSFSLSAAVANGTTYSNAQGDVVYPIAPDAGQVVNYQSGNPLPSSDYVYVAPLQAISQGGGNTEINSYVGPMNVCVGSQNYEANSPEYSECFGSTKNGCNWQSMHTEAEWNPLMINGNYDGVAGFSYDGMEGVSFAQYQFNMPFLNWNPPTDNSIATPMITGGLNSLFIDDQNNWWSSGGVYYYGYAWNSPSAPQNMQSDYTIAAINANAYYHCTQSGCTYTPPLYGYFK